MKKKKGKNKNKKTSAWLEIPKINGKIEFPNYDDIFHIGKKEIKNSAEKNVDPSMFNSISSVRRDKSTRAVTKQQFIITRKNSEYYIEDLNSTNGTYLRNINLKQTTAQKIKEGSEIIVPIEEKGKLNQLKIFFHEPTITIAKPKGFAKKKKLKKKKQVITPSPQTPKNFVDPTLNPTIPKSNSKNFKDPTLNPTIGSTGAQYYDPTQAPTIGPDEAVSTPSIHHHNAIFLDPNDPSNASNSFILIRKKLPIPHNAFRHDSGLDFSMVYKLEKSELWHIMVALGLLFMMVYHAYINVWLIMKIFYTSLIPWSQVFLDPIPIALIFCLSFIIHEMSHLQTGKHFKYQSRFCLTKVGFKSTLIFALIGLPFGLPGAAVSVGVDPKKDINEMGAIKTAGPFSNLILGFLFMVISLVLPESLLNFEAILIQGASLNFILGAFNMIPKEFRGFALDGKYIRHWKPLVYFILLISLIAGYIFSAILFN